LEIDKELSSAFTKGSRARCLALTSGTRSEVAAKLHELVKPFATFAETNLIYFPKGNHSHEEAKLGETPGLLGLEHQKILTSWWLEVSGRAETPNWDVAATCSILGRPRLMLAEAKAHDHEFDLGGGGAKEPNRQHISEAILEANCWLNAVWPEWKLSMESHYQLSNRFAWSWKVASLGVPVVLVWLGFLNAHEMKDCGNPFAAHEDWRHAVLKYSDGLVPSNVWERSIEVYSTPFLSLI